MILKVAAFKIASTVLVCFLFLFFREGGNYQLMDDLNLNLDFGTSCIYDRQLAILQVSLFISQQQQQQKKTTYLWRWKNLIKNKHHNIIIY